LQHFSQLFTVSRHWTNLFKVFRHSGSVSFGVGYYDQRSRKSEFRWLKKSEDDLKFFQRVVRPQSIHFQPEVGNRHSKELMKRCTQVQTFAPRYKFWYTGTNVGTQVKIFVYRNKLLYSGIFFSSPGWFFF
jgi:hypothetical protein